MCATAYALLVERIQQERQIAAAVMAGGRYEVEMPSLAELDIALGMAKEPPRSDLSPEQAELREALGLRG